MRVKTGQLWGAWLVVLLGLMGAGCGKSTYLVVRFTGMSLPDIYGIAVSLTLNSADGGTSNDVLRHEVGVDGGAVAAVCMPTPCHGPIALPASAAFVLNDESGPLTIAASALNAQEGVVATATKTTAVMHAQTWTVDMNLSPVTAASGAE